MKLFKTMLLLSLFLLSLIGFSQDSMMTAFKENNAKLLTKYLSKSVEISIMDKDNIYNKDQAVIILQKFFDQDPCLDFEVKHQSGPSKTNNSKFIIGEYTGTKKLYRSHFLVQDNGDQFQIIEIRIELEEEDD